MKTFFIVTLFLFTLANAQEKKNSSCAGGCCDDNDIAMAEMQEHGQHQHGAMKQDKPKKDSPVNKMEVRSSVEYACPMHPEVKSDKPGKCFKCGMSLVETKQKKETKKEEAPLIKKKMQAMAAGKYNCCIEEPCDECLKAHGSCSCKKAVKDGKQVCDECYEGWKNGEGTVSGKTFQDIKKGHNHNH